MYVNHVTFRLALWKVEGDFVDVGVGKDFGWIQQITFKTTSYWKVSIQLAYGTKGVSHGEACAWFEGAHNFVAGSTYDRKQPTPLDDDGILLQHQETKGD